MVTLPPLPEFNGACGPTHEEVWNHGFLSYLYGFNQNANPFDKDAAVDFWSLWYMGWDQARISEDGDPNGETLH